MRICLFLLCSNLALAAGRCEEPVFAGSAVSILQSEMEFWLTAPLLKDYPSFFGQLKWAPIAANNGERHWVARAGETAELYYIPSGAKSTGAYLTGHFELWASSQEVQPILQKLSEQRWIPVDWLHHPEGEEPLQLRQQADIRLTRDPLSTRLQIRPLEFRASPVWLIPVFSIISTLKTL